MSSPILSVNGLNVARGEIILCYGVDFVLNQGDICHLLGENGLGKTTLLMQLVGLLPTLQGQIDYLGNPWAKGAVYVPHQTGVHESLSVAQNLRFLLALYGQAPSDERLGWALSQVGLSGYQDVPAGELSAGQTRRVGLARLWLLTPSIAPLWILDEPLTALDVKMVVQLAGRIDEFAKQGGVVLFTSHQPLAVATKTLDLMNYLAKNTTQNDNQDSEQLGVDDE